MHNSPPVVIVPVVATDHSEVAEQLVWCFEDWLVAVLDRRAVPGPGTEGKLGYERRCFVGAVEQALDHVTGME